MSPKKLPTNPVDSEFSRQRLRFAEKYLEVADLAASEEGESTNVAVGLAVLAGIAASDAICGMALGEHYSGRDHEAAADLLARVDRTLGKQLKSLINMKQRSHYGTELLTTDACKRALRAATALTDAAITRVR